MLRSRVFFKICASISEVQLKKCKVGIFPLTLRYDVCDSDDCRSGGWIAVSLWLIISTVA